MGPIPCCWQHPLFQPPWWAMDAHLQQFSQFQVYCWGDGDHQNSKSHPQRPTPRPTDMAESLERDWQWQIPITSMCSSCEGLGSFTTKWSHPCSATAGSWLQWRAAPCVHPKRWWRLWQIRYDIVGICQAWDKLTWKRCRPTWEPHQYFLNIVFKI